jgi:hypothetical protein
MLASHEGHCSLELFIEDLSEQTSVTFIAIPQNIMSDRT